MQSLKTSWMDSPLGPLFAIADESALYFLGFTDCQGLERVQKYTQATIIPGRNQPIRSIEKELNQYFDGTLKEFTTPLFFFGTPFQKRVWEELRKIPYGKTVSYATQATGIGSPTAYRAVAQANGANPFTVVIPCHRVINANGGLGGYGGGLPRKKWLLNHEKKNIHCDGGTQDSDNDK